MYERVDGLSDGVLQLSSRNRVSWLRNYVIWTWQKKHLEVVYDRPPGIPHFGKILERSFVKTRSRSWSVGQFYFGRLEVRPATSFLGTMLLTTRKFWKKKKFLLHSSNNPGSSLLLMLERGPGLYVLSVKILFNCCYFRIFILVRSCDLFESNDVLITIDIRALNQSSGIT